ncbi:MAG TPA: DUF4238 domain-containing protein [Rhodocyclaceae bacterium]|nr:DUF4238 domain-containing protein [Rhodocyclaceae bacterium]
MQRQITRDNHYVPQWYQKGFLAKDQHKLHVLNLHPVAARLEQAVEEMGPKRAFKEVDLYTVRFGEILNDDIETFLFGKIDKNGADAVRAWIAGDFVKMHRGFQDFFMYIDAQKLRTPKGLDWILKHFQGLPQTELMVQMQSLRQMHCTMWSECVREIVSAVKSPVRFLVSDHPVTIYHPKLAPEAPACQYPNDPGVELVGSQTIFPLNAHYCLILTNLEYAESPDKAALLSRRTNARFRGESMARTDALIRGRELSEAEVQAINLVIKSRAKQYVAASNPAWLYPEKHCTLSWEGIASLLLPRNELWRFGGEIYIGYEDGSSAYRDPFGRTSKAHEFLAKPPMVEDPAPDAQCGCGGGLMFRDCCSGVAPQDRPSWTVRSIRERNLVLIRGINRILELNADTSWLDVRRQLSDEQVRKIHELFAALWPTDTRLVELLPRPQSQRSRALYLGMTDARTASNVVGMLAYIDELVLVHPFVNANGVRPEFSPTHHPAKFREQTLRSVFLLLILEPYIRDGRVHLIPDPLDYDAGFRGEIMGIAEDSSLDEVELGPIDKALADAFSRDEMMRVIKRLPPSNMKAYIAQHSPEESEATIDAVVRIWKEELESDPLALLDPPPSSEAGGEFKILKGFARETGLFIATLTGSFIYTDSDTNWRRLHETDGVRRYEEDPLSADVVRHMGNLKIEVPTLTYEHQVEPPGAAGIREFFRDIVRALRTTTALDVGAPAVVEEWASSPEQGLRPYKLQASMPVKGFQRTDVSRLVLTFGRLDDVAPVRLAVFLDPVTKTSGVRDSSN